MKITHYIRYMDNITLYARSKRALDKAIRLVREWLEGHGMRLKDNWQKFRTADRLPCALGYRYGKRLHPPAQAGTCFAWRGNCGRTTGRYGGASGSRSHWRRGCCPDWGNCATATAPGSTGAW